MLVDLVQQIIGKVTRLDPKAERDAFMHEWFAGRPEAAHAFDSAKDQATRTVLLQGMALAGLAEVKRIPEMARMMLERLNARGTNPAVRAGIATVLAYLVQPRDLIPDDAPGGFGFVDDTIVLQAGFVDVLAMEPPTEAPKALPVASLGLITTFAPANVIDPLKQTLQGMELFMQFYRALPAEVLEFTTQAIMASPLLPFQPPAMGTGLPASTYVSGFGGGYTPQYTWQDGNTIGVNFPGGGGVVSDGRDIFAF